MSRNRADSILKFAGNHAFLAILIFLSCSGPEQKIQPEAVRGVLDLRHWDFEKDGPVELKGEWGFYWKQLLLPQVLQKRTEPAPDFIYAPDVWDDHQIDGREIGGQGHATYHLRVLFPALPGALAIRLNDQGSAYTMYLNSVSLVQNGIVGENAETERPLWLPRYASLSVENSADFVMQISNYFHRQGGLWRPAQIGTINQIQDIRDRGRIVESFLAGSLLIMGLYHLALFFYRKKDRAALWFGLLCLFITLRLLVTGERLLTGAFPLTGAEFFLKLEYLSFYLSLPLTILFLHALFPDIFYRPVLRGILVLSLFGSTTVLALPAHLYSYTIATFQAFAVIAGAYGCYILIRASFQGQQGARLILAGWIVLFSTVINDIVYNLFLIGPGFLAPAGLFIFIFAQAGALAHRIASAFNTSEELSVNLERKVAGRTQELQAEKNNLKDAMEKIELLAESRKKLSVVGQVAAGIVHDIKNPMATIRALAELTNTDLITKEKREANLNMIVREMDRLNDLAYEILDFSKGQLTLDLTEVNLREFIDEIAKFLKINFDYLKILYIQDLQYEGPVIIDKDRIRRVVINIAKNALEAMQDGKKEYSFTIRSEEKSGKVTLSLIDNGPGLPAALSDRIFDAFATEGKSKGVGLGLFMCKWIVDSHQGELTYRTKPDVGTTFFITLPLRLTHEVVYAI